MLLPPIGSYVMQEYTATTYKSNGQVMCCQVSILIVVLMKTLNVATCDLAVLEKLRLCYHSLNCCSTNCQWHLANRPTKIHQIITQTKKAQVVETNDWYWVADREDNRRLLTCTDRWLHFTNAMYMHSRYRYITTI